MKTVARQGIFLMSMVGVLAIGCAKHLSPQMAPSKVFSPSELNQQSKLYDQKEVLVEGYVTLGPSAHTIYETKSLSDEFRKRWDSADPSFDPKQYMKYCLTIANPQVLYEHENLFAGQTVILKGKFFSKYLEHGEIDFGACPLPTAILIDAKDLRQRHLKSYSRGEGDGAN